MKVPFFIFVVLGLILGGNGYVFYRLWQLMPPTMTGRILLIASAIVLILAPVAGMAPESPLPISWCGGLSKLGTSWLIILLYLILTFICFDILRATKLFPSLSAFLNASWAGFAVLTVFMTVLLATGYCLYRDKVRVELTIPLDKPLPDGLKIVAVSDLHLGYTIGKDELEEWITLINKETPDLILIAGDVTDNRLRPLIETGMAESFRRLHSRYGVYAIPGNHEYMAGIIGAAAFLRSAGITLLQDSAVLIDDRFYLVGRDDRSNPHRKTLAELTVSLNKTKPLFLLDHQPWHLEETAAAGIDFQFSGHTHGGQVWPLNCITDHLFECAHGYIKKGGSHVYVSSGLGIWGGKFRIGTRSEYVVLTLKGLGED